MNLRAVLLLAGFASTAAAVKTSLSVTLPNGAGNATVDSVDVDRPAGFVFTTLSVVAQTNLAFKGRNFATPLGGLAFTASNTGKKQITFRVKYSLTAANAAMCQKPNVVLKKLVDGTISQVNSVKFINAGSTCYFSYSIKDQGNGDRSTASQTISDIVFLATPPDAATTSTRATTSSRATSSSVSPSSSTASTAAPSTAAPSTAAPSTAAPSTAAPSTAAPSTAAPSTAAPSTAAPSTAAPSTAATTTATANSDPFDVTFTFVGAAPSAAFRNTVNQAGQFLSSVISKGLPDFNGVDDLAIAINITAIDGPSNILGMAGPRNLRPSSRLPYTGFAFIDEADQDNTRLVAILCHEFLHVLGIGTLWGISPFTSFIASATPNNLYVGNNGRAQYRTLFNLPAAAGVPLENGGGPGTANGHWEEDVFKNELMTGFLNAGDNPISTVSIGALQDLGYSVNYNVATYTVPSAAAQLVSEDELGGKILAVTNQIIIG